MKNKLHSYNATVAKIMAMYGKRVTPADYAELCSSHSVLEVAEYLKKNTHLSGALAGIDTSTIHRGMLEDLLQKNLFEMYMRITDFEHIGRQEFYNYKVLQSEMNVILSCIRHINAGSENQINEIPIYLNRLTCFDLIRIAKARSFGELLECIEKTPYHDILKKEKTDENGKADYFSCERKLRIYYYERIEKTISDWGAKEAEQLNSMILTDVDLINIINSYRMKSFFGDDGEEISEKMLPFYGRLSPEKLEEIYSARDKEEFIKRFSATVYGRQLADSGCDMNDLEHNANLLRYKYAKLALKKSSSAPVSVYSFMYLMNIELKNITSIIEGVRYGLPPKQIESLIIA